MKRLRDWLTRPDAETDLKRAQVAVLLSWFGCALGGFLAVWGAVIHSMGSVMQGLALVVLALAVMLKEPRR